MGNYKLIEVTKKLSGQETQSIYDHTDLTALKAAMDNDFGVQVKDETTASVYCLAIDNDTGEKIGCNYWALPVPEPPYEEEVEIPDVAIRHRVYTHNDYAEDNISAYATDRDAVGNYYAKSAASKRKIECMHALTILLDGKGEFIEYENWNRTIEE